MNIQIRLSYGTVYRCKSSYVNIIPAHASQTISCNLPAHASQTIFELHAKRNIHLARSLYIIYWPFTTIAFLTNRVRNLPLPTDAFTYVRQLSISITFNCINLHTNCFWCNFSYLSSVHIVIFCATGFFSIIAPIKSILHENRLVSTK